MRDKNVYNRLRALPRMSWSAENLYNLWQRSFGMVAKENSFTSSAYSLFAQRWIAKRVVRGYHGDFIGDTKFKRWYLPTALPDVRARRRHGSNMTPKDQSLAKSSQRVKDAAKDEVERAKKEEEEGNIPVGSLFLSEIERRLDVVVFRACLSPSVYHARHIIIRGGVRVNGKLHTNANTRMNPGDMVSVNPSAIPFLRHDALKNDFLYGSITTLRGSTASTKQDDTENKSEVADTALSAEISEETSGDEGEGPDGEATALDSGTSRAALVPTTPSSIEAGNGSVFHLPPWASPFLFIPAYLEVNFPTCSLVYVRHPTARPGYSEVPTPYDADGEIIRLAWEWYSRNRPRMRRKRDLWMSPDRSFGQWQMM